MAIYRRTFIAGVGTLIAASSMPRVTGLTTRVRARGGFNGYGRLVKDPMGILDLPPGFRYSIVSCEGDALSGGGLAPSNHDGMAAFAARRDGVYLVRNHEIEPSEIEEDDKIAVSSLPGADYDPEGVAAPRP